MLPLSTAIQEFGVRGGSRITMMDGVVPKTYSTKSAFALVRADGSVVTWGIFVGNSEAVRQQLTGIKSISSTGSAFAAIKDDGSVVTWGDAGAGHISEALRQQLTGDERGVKRNHDGFRVTGDDVMAHRSSANMWARVANFPRHQRRSMRPRTDVGE